MNAKFTPLKLLTIDFQRKKVAEALSQCTPKQQAFFSRLYPTGVDKMPAKNLCNAYDQCMRTIINNANAEDPKP